MTHLDGLQIRATVIGFASAGIVLVWRRLGAPSWLLSRFLLLASLLFLTEDPKIAEGVLKSAYAL